MTCSALGHQEMKVATPQASWRGRKDKIHGCDRRTSEGSVPGELNIISSMAQWYQLETDEVLKQLTTSKTGLTSAESKKRLEQYGYNELRFKKRSPLIRFILQFHNSLVYVILASALITMILGMWTDA